VVAGCDSAATVSYSKDVRPIIDGHCMECHKIGGKGESKSGLSMESYDDLMKGTKFGPMITPGDSFGSNLIILIEGRADPSIYMPKGKHGPLTKEEIELIKKWIDQGAQNN
jgi:uncharacterized membrane protein